MGFFACSNILNMRRKYSCCTIPKLAIFTSPRERHASSGGSRISETGVVNSEGAFNALSYSISQIKSGIFTCPVLRILCWSEVHGFSGKLVTSYES